MTVRKAEPRDAARVTELLRGMAQLHGEGRPDVFKQTQKYGENDVLGMITDPDILFLVADDGSGEPAGYIICMLKTTEGHALLQDSRVLWVDDLCVAESARGLGYGRALCDAAFRLAAAEGCCRAELNVWQFNRGAIAFYEQLGMTPQRTVMEIPLVEKGYPIPLLESPERVPGTLS